MQTTLYFPGKCSLLKVDLKVEYSVLTIGSAMIVDVQLVVEAFPLQVLPELCVRVGQSSTVRCLPSATDSVHDKISWRALVGAHDVCIELAQGATHGSLNSEFWQI
jgi:hypothetical protein